MEFFHKVTRFPFMQTRKVWYGLSAVLIVASIGLVAVRGLNLGVDFTGGELKVHVLIGRDPRKTFGDTAHLERQGHVSASRGTEPSVSPRS